MQLTVAAPLYSCGFTTTRISSAFINTMCRNSKLKTPCSSSPLKPFTHKSHLDLNFIIVFIMRVGKGAARVRRDLNDNHPRERPPTFSLAYVIMKYDDYFIKAVSCADPTPDENLILFHGTWTDDDNAITFHLHPEKKKGRNAHTIKHTEKNEKILRTTPPVYTGKLVSRCTDM